MANTNQKTIFITGAGSGIGRATAQLFAERGWFVGLSDINPQGLEETAAMLPEGQRISVMLDTRDRAAWARAIETFGQVTNRRMDILFNNAGVGKGGWLEDMNVDEIDLVLDVNLKGVINGCIAALPLVKEAQGRIINVASVAGVFGAPKLAVYCASKFGVRGLTEALDVEYSRFGVRVVSLMPWFMDTAILDGHDSRTNRNMRDQLVEKKTPIYPVRMAAERAWDAAHGKEIHYMVGKEAERARFAARFFPNAMRNSIKKTLVDD